MKILILVVFLVGCKSEIPCSKDLTRPLSECNSHSRVRARVCDVEIKTNNGVSCVSRGDLRQILEGL